VSSSSTSSAGPSPETKSTKEPPILANVALATALFGFVGYIFWYSMDAVGRGDAPSNDDDPLAQLRAEAMEAAQDLEQHRRRPPPGVAQKMTPEEIAALESGMSMDAEEDENGNSNGRRIVQIAVAAPADIAAVEEEANLKIFQQKQPPQNGEGPTKKKPWWRFGF
jgi:hypothetical protein